MQDCLQKIKLLALDVDGVLTDGTINIAGSGEIFKGFNAKDGLGISCAMRSGVQVAIITGRKSDIIHRRAAELGITIICEGVHDKYTALVQLTGELGLMRENAAYIGDDLNDLPAFAAAGVSMVPQDAAAEVQAAADFVLAKSGGRGAVREAVEMILTAQGKWSGIVAAYKACGQGDRQ